MNVLMVGPARSVKGGMTTVVDNYFKYGLLNFVDLDYCESICDKSPFEKVLQEVKGYLYFLKVLPKNNIVHIHMASGRSAFRKIIYIKTAKKYHKKIVLHIHGGGFADFFDGLSYKKKNKVKQGLELVDRIIVLSQEWRDYFSKIINENKIQVLYNGVEFPCDFEKKYNNNILFLGRICEDKGIYNLLHAIKELAPMYPDINLNICGCGQENHIFNFIERNNLKKNINFVGWVSNREKENQLINNSIFILPSKFEAMPMSLLEAMAYKNIPICTNVGGIPQVVEDSVNGFLLVDNSAECIIKVLKKVLNQDQRKKNISENAYNTIKDKFDIKNNINILYKLYNEVLEGKSDEVK